MKLGDAVASVATPIARALKLDCIDPETQQLRPDSPCAQRKQTLNHLFDFFGKPKHERTNMQFAIQIIVEAENARKAMNMIPETLEVASITPRPQPPATNVSRPASLPHQR